MMDESAGMTNRIFGLLCGILFTITRRL